ncbi:MAG: MHYT domain-containing protein [Paracoccaceae bacterium]|nr:MHYT domain-containing protein [Paracoccaceae bacterium]
MLEFTHNPWLVLASVAVALMAGFTGLSLTRGASDLAVGPRKLVVVMAAVALGGGIWSMHFVAMLGLQLPVLFYYDALITLISALLAILMVGMALLILHFVPRSTLTLTLAGAIVGLGIGVMHFVGMLGMEVCRAVNTLADYLLSGAVAVLLSVGAVHLAYGARRRRNIALGTLGFALAVVAVHFLAIAQTGFTLIDGASPTGALLSNKSLALGVTIAVFLICGAFLLTSVTYLAPSTSDPKPDAADPPAETPAKPQPEIALAPGVPFTREGHTQFAPRDSIAAVRAEGHYTLLYVGDEKLFCPWSITEAETRLTPSGFVRTHRSYLVNPSHVSGFERMKDTGTLWFDHTDSLPKVPVSRSRLAAVREALGL